MQVKKKNLLIEYIVVVVIHVNASYKSIYDLISLIELD